MIKNLINWMMALVLVATPILFTACGSDDDGNNGDASKQTVTFVVSEEFSTISSTNARQASAAIDTIRETMFTAMFASVGQTYNEKDVLLTVRITIAVEDESKMLAALDATYAQLKNTEMYGGYLMLDILKVNKSVKVYKFGVDSNANNN